MEIQKVVAEEVRQQKEAQNCLRSMLIKNVDKSIADIGGMHSRLSLLDQVTKFLHNICNDAVSVLDVYIHRGPTIQLCLCAAGLIKTKICMFPHPVGLQYIKENKAAKEASNISFCDVFAKDKLPDVKKLVSVAKFAEQKEVNRHVWKSHTNT
jgi:hypothetical protein